MSPLRRGAAVLAALLVTLGAGCREPVPALRIGVPLWPGYEPAFYARHLGLLDSSQVVLVDFLDGAMASRAFRDGGVDAVMLTLPSAISSAEIDTTLRVAQVLDVSEGADAVVGSPPVRTMRELKGRTVAIDATGTGAVLVARGLAEAGLSLDDVRLVRLNPDQVEAALFSGKVAGALTYEPRLSELVARGAHKLFDTARMPGAITDILLVHEADRTTRAAALAHFAAAWHRGRAAMLGDPEEAARVLAARERTDTGTFRLMLRGLAFPTAAEGERMLRDAASPMRRTAASIAQEMQRQGMLRAIPDLDRLLGTPPATP